MQSLIHHSRLTELIKQRNGYLVLASGLLILSLLLLGFCFYLSDREKVVLVPPSIQNKFWVSASAASPEYLSEMTVFFAYLRLNQTPESADTQRQLLLRYTDPRYFSELDNRLVAERDRIVSQHVSTAFYPVNIKVDAKSNSAKITGDLLSTIGSLSLPPQRVVYEIHYHYDNGRLWVADFEEMKVHV